MFVSKLLKAIKWFILGFFIWLAVLAFQIISFPVGTLNDKADIAIVLGAAVNSDKPSPVFKERINHAVNLYKDGNIQKILFTGGKGENKAYAESVVAKEYSSALGVLQDDIMIESESRTTKENILQSKKLLEESNLKSALLVTDPLHTKRAMMIAKDNGFIDISASATPTSLYKSWSTKIPFLLRELYFYHHYILFNE